MIGTPVIAPCFHDAPFTFSGAGEKRKVSAAGRRVCWVVAKSEGAHTLLVVDSRTIRPRTSQKLQVGVERPMEVVRIE